MGQVAGTMRHPHPAVLTLPPNPRSAADARRFVERILRGWRCPDAVELTQLLVSELVSNAVRHAGTPIRLVLRVRDGRVSVEVTDGASDPPRPRLAEPDSEAGRGLFLIDQLARDWGVRPERRGKTVWFVLDPLSQAVPAG